VGPPNQRAPCLLVFWSFGLLVFWSFGLLVFWSFGLLVFWSFGGPLASTAYVYGGTSLGAY